MALAVCAVVLTAPMLVSANVPAQAATRCAPASSKYIGGTVLGQDGRDINAQVSLNVVDSHGRSVDPLGCRTAGYTRTLWLNKGLSGNGAFHTSRTTRTWRYSGLPSNAAAVWIEVWTRTNTPTSCATCDGPIDTHRYGFVNRRAVRVNSGNVRLIAPLHCGAGSGTTGTIQGALLDKNHRPVIFSSIHAWSMLTPDGSRVLQGWGQAVQRPGHYVIDALASGQDYVVWATYHGVTTKRYHITVGTCANVPLRFVATS